MSKLIESYIHYTLEHNKKPENVYLFAKSAGIEEKTFYDSYASLEALEDAIFLHWFEEVKHDITHSDLYNTYSSREKLLSIFYGWIEKIKGNRTFVKFMFDTNLKPLPNYPRFLRHMKVDFVKLAQEIVQAGIDKQEVTDRKYLSDRYGEALWVNMLFVTGFWLKDQSAGFEKTDEAIERSVNLAFDLMGRSPLDSMIDFGKFLFQNS
jgi:AcrR family transcriptional regulator